MPELGNRIRALPPEKLRLLVRRLKEKGAGAGETGSPLAPPPLLRSSEEGPPPLSFQQLRLWFLTQVEPENPFYNNPAALRLRGPLDLGVLRASLDEVVRRQDVLRTTFSRVDGTGPDGGEPVQVVAPELEVPLSVVDLGPQRHREAARLSAAEMRRHFDVANGPLLRLTVLRLGPVEHRLLISVHHLLADGWSVEVLRWELGALYQAFSRGEPSPLPELPLRYADFARWQRRWLRGEVLEAQLAYWRERLAGLPPLLALPSDRPRPAVQSYRGSTIAASTPRALRDALAALARRHRVSLFVTLLAAFETLLLRYTGRDQVVVGVPIAYRNWPETENLIGFFANTLVLRGDLSGDPSIGDLLLRLQEVVAGAFEHQDLPFERLVADLKPARDPGHSPIFQVAFAMQDYLRRKLQARDGHGPVLTALKPDVASSNFDLTLYPYDSGEAVSVVLEYSVDLFDRCTIRRLWSHYETLLAGAVAAPAARLSELPAASAAEVQQLLVEWLDTRRGPRRETCLDELFEAQAERTPDRPALSSGGEVLTYGSLDARAERLAHVLRDLGAGPEVCLALCAERDPRMVVGILGILKAGAAYVPLERSHPAERLAFVLADSGAALVVTTTAARAALPPHPVPVVCLDEPAGPAAVDRLSSRAGGGRARGANLAYVIYTSGSTGRPKGVQVTHDGLANYLAWAIDAYAVPEGRRALLHTSLGVDLTVTSLFVPLLAGQTVRVVPESEDPAALWDALREPAGFSLVKLTPSHLELLRRTPGGVESLGPVDTLVLGGEALLGESLAEWRRHAPRRRLVNEYGPTETVVGCVAFETALGAVPDGVVPIGRAIANVEVYVLDRRARALPAGVPGELAIGGRGVARGYVGAPSPSAEEFVPNPFGTVGERLYKSGDLVRARPDGNLVFIGRIDHQVKVRGFRVEPGEIESVLTADPAVREAVVMARPAGGGDGPGTLVAYLVPAAGATPPPRELRRRLLRRLPSYMVPASFVILEAMPLTAAGKVDRRGLPAPEAARIEPGAAPSTAAEETLAEIWSQVLRLERVSRHDNFFALGGDSILGLQVVSRANQAGLSLVPRQVFEHQTLARLAAVAGTVEVLGSEQGPVSGKVPLTPIQHWFFEQRRAEPWHFNQALLLAVEPSPEPALLDGALRHLVLHHDSLRSRFPSSRSGHGRRQWVAAPEATRGALVRVDLSALAEARAAIRAAASRVQASLDLERGPLARFVLFTCGAQRADRLLLVAHHLVVDGVSWRILVEDLGTLYGQLSRGESPRLPAKTTSYKRWAERLVEHSHSGEPGADLPRWNAAVGAQVLPLPRDGHGADPVEGSNRVVSARLTEEETRSLLREVPAAYRTRIDDVLLCALARGFAPWTGARALLVDLEGHGREAIFDDLDLSRTVGWFTTIFPVLLDPGSDPGPGAALMKVKEQLRSIPGRGLSYGLLRYLGDATARSALAELPRAEVSFNYLGQLDPPAAAGPEGSTSPNGARPAAGALRLSMAPEATGPARSPRGRRRYLLELDASVVGERLRLRLTYSPGHHRRESAEKLLASVMASLRRLMAHCLSPEAGGVTPSDFPLAALSQQDLDRVLGGARQAREIEDLYPLSPLQQGLLFHTLYAPEAGFYVTQVTCTLRGRLDAGLFHRAWQSLVERHPVLRTFFLWQEVDEPLQAVEKRVTVKLDAHDWRRFPAGEQRERLAALLGDERQRGFDLSTAPLMRLALLRLAEETWQMVWSHHHLLLDGWSLEPLFKEVFALYTALAQSERPRLAAIRPYRDYVAWLGRQDLEAAEAYWRRTLAGFRAPTELPHRAEGHPQASGAAAEHRRLHSSTTAALGALARRLHLTLAALVQGAWGVVLSRYSGEEDVVFGVTVSGRPADLPGAESMLGPFVNTLPVRLEVPAGQRLSTWLAELQTRQARMREYEYSPLVRVQGWSEVPRGTPLFDTILVVENYPLDASLRDEARRIESGFRVVGFQSHERTHYALGVAVTPGEELALRILYDRGRFDATTVGRTSVHMAALLEAMVEDPERRLAALPLLAPAQRQQLLVEWNDTLSDEAGDRDLCRLFEARAARSPDRLAVVLEERALSYRELNRSANRLGRHLRALGVGPEVLVGLAAERSPEMVTGLVGVLKAGGAFVPLDPSYPKERLRFMLDDAGVAVLLSQEPLARHLPRHEARELFLDADRPSLSGYSAENLSLPIAGAGLAYVIYTSGSTGRPKGVALTRGGLGNLARAQQSLFGLDGGHRVLQFSSLSFDASVWEVAMALAPGATLVLGHATDLLPGAGLRELARRRRVNVATLPPSALAASEGLESLETLVVAGEACTADLVDRWAPGRRFWNAYGPSEGTVCATAGPCRPGSGSPPIGRPLANAAGHAVDGRLCPVPVGVAGELAIGGAGLARGYLRRGGLTAEKFVPSPWGTRPGARLYHTGDLVRRLPAGELFFLGRIDHQVKVRGFRVELGEIESILSARASVQQAVVVARREETPRLVAYVVPEAGGEPAVGQLREELRARLPEHMVPDVFVTLEALPLSPSGKVDRRALPRPDESELRGDRPFEAPCRPAEELLAAIWSEVLGVERIGARDHFFELGGHSLLATRMVSRVRAAFGVEAPLPWVFELPVLADLAARIDAAQRRERVGKVPPIRPRQRNGERDGLPLSFAQERLYFLDQLAPGTPLYNIASMFRAAGTLRQEVLERALTRLVKRHETLRTSFHTLDGRPVQVVAKSGGVRVPRIDLRSLPAARRRAELVRLGGEQAARPFDLARGPLLRLCLVRPSDGEDVVVMAMHHIISDEWSIGVLMAETTELYTAFMAGRDPELPTLPVRYADFALWQREWLQGETLERLLEYWKRQLSPLPPPLELPTDRRRPAIESYRGARRSARVPPPLADALRALARQRAATLYMSLLAAFKVLLRRTSGQADLAVGSPIAHRHHLEIEGLIGFFVNTLVLRTDLAARRSFAALLERVREITLEAYAHQDLPFERLVAELKPRRDTARTPLFQVTFVLQNAPPKTVGARGLGLRPQAVEVATAKFDLELTVVERARGFSVVAQYRRDLFDSTTIRRLLAHFTTLLDAVVKFPERHLDALAWLSQGERQELLVEWNDTRGNHRRQLAIHELFEEQARRAPEVVALVGAEQSLSYGELNRRANQLAHYLRGLGVATQSLVGLFLERSPEVLIAMLGILKSGGGYVPLDPASPRERLKLMLDDTRASVLLTEERSLGALPEPAARLVCLDRDREAIGGASTRDLAWDGGRSRPGPDHLAYVMYTSGSTGRPKGVGVAHRGVVRLVREAAYADFSPQQVFLQLAPLSFDASTLEIWGPLTNGGRLVIFPAGPLSLSRLAAVVERHRVSTLWLTAGLFRQFVEDRPAGVEPLRQLLAGGDVLSAAHVERVLEQWAGVRLINGYGPTENTTFTCCHPLAAAGEMGSPVPIGRPISDTAVYLLDRRGRPVPVGVAGQLWTGGEGLMRGYLGRPRRTAESLVPDSLSGGAGSRLYGTGDLARRLAGGEIEFLGRFDHQVKVRGYRVEPGEVETVLARHPAVREAVVVAREDVPGDRRLVAYVWAAAGTVPPAGELRDLLRRHLPEHMVPAAFVTPEVLPLTAHGKVDRRALPAPAGTRPSDSEYVAPASELEQTLTRIWEELVGIERVGVRDNFFDLGGHSLLLVRMRERLREALGREVPMVDLLRHTTVTALARHLDPRHLADSQARHGRRRADRRLGSATAPAVEIAVVGMAGRFPGAPSLDRYWSNLRDGVESVSFPSDEELLAAGVDAATVEDPRYVKAGAFLEQAEWFDAPLFHMSPREARMTDPQHRLFLECAWEALENAGYAPEAYDGAIGVYAGVGVNYYWLRLLSDPELMAAADPLQVLIGNADAFLTTRLSYKLDLKGPSVDVQTACSTSLVATHLACRGLAAGECDMALAGGVSISTYKKVGYFYQEGGIASPDGRCRAFDAAARGSVGGSGAGIVVLKRLADARADGDTVRAVIRGSATNNDGASKVGFTAPGVEGQARVIAEAQAMAGVAPEAVSYVETHGTATALGDPIEVAALKEVFGHEPGRRCALGSVKTNIGHTDAAAGAASLIKTVLALEHRQIPPSLHFEKPNPEIDFESSPLYVNTRLAPWPANGAPRRAGVSAFGLGGTNAHVVLEEAPGEEPSGPARREQLLVLSAASASALESVIDRLSGHLGDHPRANLADVAFTCQVGRRRLEHRSILVCEDVEDAAAALATREPTRLFAAVETRVERPVAFLFPGLGDHHAGMARELYDAEPTFRRELDRCAGLLEPHLGVDPREPLVRGGRRAVPEGEAELDLRRLLEKKSPAQETADGQLGSTRLAQPVVFTLEYCLARLWQEWGIRPQAMIGYSLGEYTAACLAGVLRLEDALDLVARRARLIDTLPTGAMLAVPLAEREVLPLLGRDLSLAATNGPRVSVVAGPEEAVEALEGTLADREIAYRRLRAPHAFHSTMMNPIAERFAGEVGRIELRPPRIPYLSNVTGRWITAREATDPRYWARHLCRTVRFAEGLEELLGDAGPILLEVGPGQALGTAARQHPARPAEQVVLSSMPDAREKRPRRAFLLNSLGRLWLAGAAVDWHGFSRHERRRRVPLPTYPFERQRYWVEPSPGPAASSRRAARKKKDIADWFYLPSWRQSPPPRPLAGGDLLPGGRWLVWVDECGLGRRLAERLRQTGQDVVVVRPGSTWSGLERGEASLDPRRPEDYGALVRELHDAGALPRRIVHLWSVTPREEGGEEETRFDSLFSIFFLVRALAAQGVSEDLRLTVISNHVQKVEPRDTVAPAKATVLGALKVLPQEYRNVTCHSIDVALPEPGSRREDVLVDRLLTELVHPAGRAVAYRQRDRRFEQRFDPVRLEATREPRPGLRPGGVYLVTGAFGLVGRILTRYLAGEVGARLILTGSSPLPASEDWDAWLESREPEDRTSRRIRQVRALEEAGAEVLALRADVASRQDMEAVIGQALRRFGEINGVIHLAGATGDGSLYMPIEEVGPAECERQFRPKVHGLITLKGLLEDLDLDFCLLFSSVASIVGGLGFAAYACANTFMDAFAQEQSEDSRFPWSSVNWDSWGKSTDEAADTAGLGTTVAQLVMKPDEGTEAFHRVLSMVSAPQVVVSLADLDRRLAQWVEFRADTAPESSAADTSARHRRPDLQTAYVAPTTETEGVIAELWQEMLGIEEPGIHDNFFELGGDSLLGTQLVSKLRRRVQLELPVRAFFEAPTVAELAALIERRRHSREEESEIERALRQIQELSAAETRSMLDRRLGETDP